MIKKLYNDNVSIMNDTVVKNYRIKLRDLISK